MSTRTVKDVNEKTWRKLRLMSAEYDMRIGELIEKMTEDYEKSSRDFWKTILEGEKILTEKEAEELKSVVTALRKETGFR